MTVSLVFTLPLNKGEVPKAEGDKPMRLRCEGATPRERKTSAIARPFAGGGVPPDRRRNAAEAGGQGETRSGSPIKKVIYKYAFTCIDSTCNPVEL